MRRILIVLAALLVVVLLLATRVGPEGSAVRETLGGETVALPPGVHLRVPLYHRVYRYDAAPVPIDEALPIVTRDDATFKMPCRISVHVSPGDVLTFHRGRSGRETETYLRDTTLNAVRDAARTMTTDQILTKGAGTHLAQRVSADLIARGISDDSLDLGAPAPQVVFNAVLDYLNRKLPASARKLAESALRADPDQALNHAALGAVLESEGRAPEAEQQYLEGLYLDPAASEPMSRLYVMYQTSHDPAALGRLQRLLSASIEKKKDSPVHHDWLGQVYMRTRQLDKAEQSFKTAIALAPTAPEFRISLGSLRAQQDRLDDAIAAYEEALKLRPNHPLGLYNLGVVHALKGDLDGAIKSFEAAQKAGPPSVALLNALAQAYEQQGKLPEAAESLRRSLAQRPGQPERAAALKRIETQLRTKKS